MSSYQLRIPPPPYPPYYEDAVTGHPIDVQYGDLWRRTDIKEITIDDFKCKEWDE